MSEFSLAEFFSGLKQLFRDVRILSGNDIKKTVIIGRDEDTIHSYHVENLNVIFVEAPDGQLEFDQATGTLRIPYTAQSKDELVRIIQEAFSTAAKGSTVARKDIYGIRRDYYEYKTSSDSRELLAFYRGIIPEGDIPILRTAVFIRALALKRENVRKHKRDLTDRYGDRGRHICNMVTAGYFDTFLPRLHEENTAEFRRLYEIIVTENPLAVFVSDPQTVYQIVQNIKRSVRAALRYRTTDSVNVHAFGRENALKVERILNDPEFEPFREHYRTRSVERQDTLVIVKNIPRGPIET